MDTEISLHPDFREFIQLLNAHDVQYLVVGGFAVTFHGYPRATKDIDIWIWLDAANAEKVIGALDEFGFKSLGLKARLIFWRMIKSFNLAIRRRALTCLQLFQELTSKIVSSRE